MSLIWRFLDNHKSFTFLLIIYLSLAWLYSLNIPLSKAPDEYVHFLYIRFLRDEGRPPVDLQEQQIAGYKSDQPPLYHALAALLTAPVDVSEPPSFKFSWTPAARRLIDIGLPRALLIHTEDETWPFAGLFLAWFMGRWFSIILSSLTLVVTYCIALEIFPGRRRLALAATGTLAFLPRYIFTGSVLSDENLVGLLMALFLYIVVRMFNRKSHRWPAFALLGGLIGLGLSTKYSLLPVPLEAFILIAWLAIRQKWSRGVLGRRLAVLAAATALAAMPWYTFLFQHFNQIEEYGPMMGVVRPLLGNDEAEREALLDVFAADESGAASPALAFPAGNLFAWAAFLFTQFWDVPIFGVPQPYPLNLVLVIGLLLGGLALFGWLRWLRRADEQSRVWVGLLTFHLLVFVPIPLLRFLALQEIHETAQARHILFPAAPALAILLVAGVAAAFPKKRQAAAGAAVMGFTFLLAAAHLYYYIVGFPAPLPVRSASHLAARPGHPLPVEFAGGLHLRGYDWRLGEAGVFDLTLYWRLETVVPVDYLTEIVFTDSHHETRRRWLSHPAAGRFPTRAWDAGDSVRDRLHIPLAGLPAGRYQAALRLLDEELQPVAAAQGETIALTDIEVGQTPAVEEPILWQAGQPIKEATPEYRYRATIPISVPPGKTAQLIDLAGQTYAPIVETDQLSLFIVSHTWPSGLYEVQVNGTTSRRLRVTNFEWTFTPPQMMQPVEANFNDAVNLLGYDLPVHRVEAGGGVPLVLYWQSLRRMEKSYIIFNRLLDSQGRAWGGYDRLPKETYPTTLWVPGEVVADGFAVPVDPAAPDGVYTIVIGLYEETDPAAVSVPLVQDGQATGVASVQIGPIKVGGPPAGVVAAGTVAPDHSLSLAFGQPPVIRLRGYDLSQEAGRVNLTFYWESLDRTATDWSIFAHVRDQAGQTIAQQDRPAGGGRYPTSLWDRGEVVVDDVTITLPVDLPAHEYKLVIGLYDLATEARLTVPDAIHNEVSLTLLELTP